MMKRTKLTEKAQTTIPKAIREYLGVGAGDTVDWYILEGRVIVDSRKRVKKPADVLLSAKVRLDEDAVRLVRRVREEIS
ncbi:MAG: AbrB/MazE/SpoVT family DNA-binding domain-containing protein [Thermoplasmata archaeon]